jgi:nucleoid DNA-binding protein
VADYYEFFREERLGSSWPTWPVLVGQITMGAKPLRVCLCGTPLTPETGGIRGGRTYDVEVSRLMASLEQGQELRDGNSVLAVAAQHLALPEEWEVLSARLKTVERKVGQQMRSGPGRPWRLPTRMPDAKGRDQFVLALEKAGLTSRKAKAAVSTIWKSMIAALRRGEVVETPLGTFRVARGPKPRRRKRWGNQQVVNRRLWKIRFVPSPELRAACASPNPDVPTPKEVSVPNVSVSRDQLYCEKCGSAYFVESNFQQQGKQYLTGPGAEVNPFGNSIRALVCLCGQPIQCGKLRRLSTSREDYASFQKSFEAARQYRERSQPQAILARVSQSFVSREQYDRLADQITSLETILRSRTLEPPKSPDAPTPSPTS